MSSGLTGSCFGKPGEVDDLRALGRHLERRLLRRLRRRRDADALGADTSGPREDLLDAVVLAGHPGVVDRLPDRVERDLEPFGGDIRQEHLRGTPVSRHHGLPAPDRPGAEDHDGVAEPDVQLFDPVQRAGERIGHRREIARQLRRQRDQVLRRDRRHARSLGVRARERARTRRADGPRRGSGSLPCTIGTRRR